MRRARLSLVITSVALLLSAGCGFRSDRFYTLSAPTAAPPAPHTLRVGLGPVVLPAYLEQPSLATRVDANRLQYASHDRWAAPLGLQVPRVLAENLGTGGTISVVPYPWYPSTAIDVVVRVNLQAFECDPDGTAHLDAAWSVLEPRPGAVRRRDRTTLTEAAAGRTTEAAVAALSRTLVELARRITEELPAAR
jgi:uncharacterized lipoprotein YmbA